jgi:hypothetical protein
MCWSDADPLASDVLGAKREKLATATIDSKTVNKAVAEATVARCLGVTREPSSAGATCLSAHAAPRRAR